MKPGKKRTACFCFVAVTWAIVQQSHHQLFSLLTKLARCLCWFLSMRAQMLMILSRSSVMGVRGLQGFVGSTCPHICTVVNFKELAEHHRNQHPGCTPTIVVDAMCCLRYWYTPESWICGGQWREYFSSLRDFVKTFTTVGIKLIFFFDGMVEQEKRDEWVKRRLKNNREISRIFHYIKSHKEQPGRNMFFIPSGLAIFTRFALKALGQETLCSLQEADYEVASYGFQNNCLGILGEDTDYLIYDTCPYFSIGDLCLESLSTVMLCRKKLCESLNINVADLPLLACLLGNDIIPEGMFESFRYKCLSSYTSVKENFDKKGNVILAVADHISKVLHLHQGEKKLEDMLPLGPNRALFYKGVASYLLPGQKSPWFFQKPKSLISLDKQVVSMSSDPESKQGVPMCIDYGSKQGLPMCTDPESNQGFPMCTPPKSNQGIPMCTPPESKQAVPMCTDPESKQGVPMCTDPESKQGVPMCTDPESKQGVPMCTDPESKQGVPMCTDPESKQEVPMCTPPESRQGVPMCTDPESRQGVPVCTDPESRQGVPVCTDPESRQGVPVCTDPESRQGVSMCTDPESKQGVPMYTDPEFKQGIPMYTDPEFKQGVPMCTDSKSKQGIPIYIDPESRQGVPMCTDPEIKQKLPPGADPEFKLEAPMCTNPAIKEDLVNMEPEVKQVTLVSDPDILKVARAHHVQAESYLVYNIMSSGEIECSNTLEDALDQALPSQAFVYRPVRQRVYSLLLGDGGDGTGTCPTVKEWFVYSGNPLRHPDLVRPLQMNIPGGTPNLKLLWLNQEPGTQARRMEALLGCFDLSSSREELQAVENPFRALCCLLTYLFVQVDTLCLEDLHAFIAQALCLQGKSTVQLVDLQLDYIDSRAVQLGSLLVRGLTTLVLVNSACGFPWRTSDFMPWNVFDGKLFHQKYLQSEKGYAAEALVEHNRSRLTRFHALKSVVCKACAKENRRIVSRQHWRSHQPGRWGRQGSGSHRTSSGCSRADPGQHWRDSGPGSRQYEPDPWRRYSSSSGWSN
ncbi:constitutive coactivator of peroxisome proliferator-activated receptor gamma isoform X1 [Vulpes lagopus]|uniref:constitutive coactivator of peroxisome proliferator-activated receptor gamma isoform X1 n=2 Tax=Vulpes lagopus TaxID=494514 RepID=UPI001BC9E277|nr:constitutive coactivator of peroxisome proliferator-activated receptor gamma isoform X1 [Vulpes lagopus]XP_041602336.1 constitutive coactivator of peroxisome proliferator-activated receptor gamma isoform X1 [Vulpes lagopus]